jgi:alpha/beta superfamily hydrolase
MVRPPAEEEPAMVRAGSLELEARIAAAPESRFGAVICHPHPQYGGDMDNSVVAACVAALRAEGIATLRFNFRGVGGSEGHYGGGAAEIEDARAAVSLLRERAPRAALSLGGYSFGAMVALLAGAEHPEIDRLFAIALPVTMFDADPIAASVRPKLFVFGDRDPYCPRPELERLVGRLAGIHSMVLLAGADHFLSGFEGRVGAEVVRFVREPIGS